MIELEVDLIKFIFDNELPYLGGGNIVDGFDSIYGKEKNARFQNLFYRMDMDIAVYEKFLSIDEEELCDLLEIYYQVNSGNKTIEDIKNDFMIKNLLE